MLPKLSWHSPHKSQIRLTRLTLLTLAQQMILARSAASSKARRWLSTMLLLICLLLYPGSHAAPAFFPVIGSHHMSPCVFATAFQRRSIATQLCVGADYAPSGYFDPPHTVIEAYTIVERFWGRGLDTASDALLEAYTNASSVLNSRINTGSILHSYTVSLARDLVMLYACGAIVADSEVHAQVIQTDVDAGATVFTEGVVCWHDQLRSRLSRDVIDSGSELQGVPLTSPGGSARF